MQQVALPIVLSNTGEIPALREAKIRIQDRSPYTIVGAFFFQTGRSLLPENVAKTLENSKQVYVMSTQRAWTKDLALKGVEAMQPGLDVASKLTYKRKGLNYDLHLGIR